MTAKLYEEIARTLHQIGIDTMFGVLGDGNIRFAVEAGRVHGARYVGARHENAAVAMADGYARMRGSLGVATVTTGPGVTNALTALIEATKARTPFLLLTGATARRMPDYPQLIDQDGIVSATGAGVQRYRGPEFAGEDLYTACRRAVLETRPVMFAVPTDDQDAVVEPTGQAERRLPAREPAVARPESVSALAELVEAADRPVPLAGWGAVVSGAQESLSELGARIGALLATSATAIGLFGNDPWCVGASGGFASPVAAELLRGADLVLAFGASLNAWTTQSGSLYSGAKVVHVDDRAESIGVHFRDARPIVGDADLTARALVTELDRRGHRTTGYRTDAIRRRISGYRHEDGFTDHDDGATVDPRTLVLALGARLPRIAVTVVDSGAFMGFPGSYLDVREPKGFLFPQYFQSVGLGIGQTLGAAAAAPSRLPVTMIGDGGLAMSLGELETSVRIGGPHLVVVFNDAAYGAEVHIGGHHGLPTDNVRFPDADFAALARTLDARGATVRKIGDLDAWHDWFTDPTGTLVLDCKVSSSIRAPFFDEMLGPEETAHAH